jgi:hypothetical protein
MILTENKIDISHHIIYNIRNRIFWELDNSRSSYWTIVEFQGIDLHRLMHSNNLLDNIYDEINR